MYQLSYAEVLEDDQSEARRVEYAALDQAVTMLNDAARPGSAPRVGIDALFYTRRLWTAFVSDLAAPDNALPDALRANLISIGIWIMREADAIRLGQSENYEGIGEICAIVRDGLR